jgi:hypothetical protein
LEFSDINQEVIQHFTSKYGTNETIQVEVRTESPEGFDENTVRTAKENANTLGFDQAGFE